VNPAQHTNPHHTLHILYSAILKVMLQAGGVGCASGGATGCFTPMWLMVGKKAAKN